MQSSMDCGGESSAKSIRAAASEVGVMRVLVQRPARTPGSVSYYARQDTVPAHSCPVSHANSISAYSGPLRVRTTSVRDSGGTQAEIYFASHATMGWCCSSFPASGCLRGLLVRTDVARNIGSAAVELSANYQVGRKKKILRLNQNILPCGRMSRTYFFANLGFFLRLEYPASDHNA